MRHLIAIISLFPILCSAQSSQVASLPSDAEIGELLAKADQKISAFEQAIKIVRSDLDSQGDSDVLRQDTSTAANAHEIIHILQKNGPTAYGLVMLIAVLQDTALNASKTASVLLMHQGTSGDHKEANLIVLGTASTSCRDIAELLLHATLRMIDAEEDIVRGITGKRP